MTAATSASAVAASKDPARESADTLQLERQNAYLKQRCAQLQEDVTNLDAHVIRLQQELERLRGRHPATFGGSSP
jgi:molecular chaperone GrpE (heat shock protein)